MLVCVTQFTHDVDIDPNDGGVVGCVEGAMAGLNSIMMVAWWGKGGVTTTSFSFPVR